MHIGDLDRSAAERNWTAQVLVLVLDQFGLPVAGATVNGTWSGAAKGGGSCITTAGGVCTIAKSRLSLAKASVTFTVTAVAKSGAAYDGTKNADADQPPDSTGTVITSPPNSNQRQARLDPCRRRPTDIGGYGPSTK